MKLTQKRIKELIKSMTNERIELYPDFKKTHEYPMNDYKIIVIAKYNHLGGQLTAYQKILQIMQLKVK